MNADSLWAGISTNVSWLLALLVALLIGYLAGAAQRRRQNAILNQSLTALENRYERETEALLDGVKLAFSELSSDSWMKVSSRLIELNQAAAQESQAQQARDLDGRFGRMTGQIDKMQQLLQQIEQQRAEQYGHLSKHLMETSKAARELFATTEALRELMHNSSKRGQWGERLAEDLLTGAGFIAGQNVLRQATIAETGKRPDFTFLLSDNKVLHMDVKFPLENWLKAGDAIDGDKQRRLEQAFARDVRRVIDDMAERQYAGTDPRSLAIALLFIPNEPAFQAAMAIDPSLVDRAAGHGLILASPHSLIAMLALIKAALREQALRAGSSELLRALDDIKAVWADHQAQLRATGRAIAKLQAQTIQMGEGQRLEAALDKLDGLARFDRGGITGP